MLLTKSCDKYKYICAILLSNGSLIHACDDLADSLCLGTNTNI